MGMDSRSAVLPVHHSPRVQDKDKTNLTFLKLLSLYYGITAWQSSSQSQFWRKTSRSEYIILVTKAEKSHPEGGRSEHAVYWQPLLSACMYGYYVSTVQ
jgi:hypothetical protein